MTNSEIRHTQPGEQSTEGIPPQRIAVTDEATTGAGDTAGTAKEQARVVGTEAKSQARQVGHQLRERVGTESEVQAQRLAGNLRQWSDELSDMADNGAEGAPRHLVSNVARAGRSAADYLDEHGVGGAMDQVQGFARRRPGAFLIGAAVTGFAVGRIAQATKASSQATQSSVEGR